MRRSQSNHLVDPKKKTLAVRTTVSRVHRSSGNRSATTSKLPTTTFARRCTTFLPDASRSDPSQCSKQSHRTTRPFLQPAFTGSACAKTRAAKVRPTKKAQRAYPTPDLHAVEPIDAGAADEVIEASRFNRETGQRQERLDAANDNRNEQIKRLFIKGMPGWLRSKLLEQPPAATVQELCSLARKQMTIREMCRNEDHPEDGFNEISETVSQNLISALTKLSTTQEQMKEQLNELKTQKSEQKNILHEPSPATQNYGNMQNQQHNATPNTPLSNIRLLRSHMRLKKNRPYNDWLKSQGHDLLCFSTSNGPSQFGSLAT